MKTYKYTFLTPENEKLEELYIKFWQYLSKKVINLDFIYYNWDIVIYPTNFDLLLRSKKMYLSCFDDAIITLNEIDSRFEDLLKDLEIKYEREELNRGE